MQNLERSPPVAQIAFAVLLLGLLATLIAQFVLDSLADRGDLYHQLQHGLLFGGRVAVGAACLSLYRVGRRSA